MQKTRRASENNLDEIILEATGIIGDALDLSASDLQKLRTSLREQSNGRKRLSFETRRKIDRRASRLATRNRELLLQIAVQNRLAARR